MENTISFYKNLIEKSPAGYAYHRIICDGEGIPYDYMYLEINPAFEELTGLKASNIIGRKISEILPYIRESKSDWIAFYGNIAINGGKEQFEQYSEPLQKWYRVNVYSPQKGYFITHFIDISKEKEQLAELDRSNERIANIIEGTNVGTWEWNVETGETVFNERWAEIIGYSLEEISPTRIETWINFAHPEDLKKSDVQLKKVFARELDYYDTECRMRHKEGHWVWVQDRGKVVSWTPEGKPLLISGIHNDITERKQAEEALRESEERYRLLSDSTSAGIIIHKEGNIKDLNHAMAKMLGFTRNELLNKDLLGLIHADDRVIVLENIKKELTGPYEVRACKKNGEVIFLEVQAQNYQVQDEKLSAVSVWDITERKKMGMALEETLGRLNALLENSPNPISIFDKDGRYIVLADATARIMGLAPDAVRGKTFAELLPPAVADEFMQTIAKIQERKQAITKTDVIPVDGENRIYETWVFPIKESGGMIELFGAVSIDITEQKRGEVEILYLSYHDQLTGLYNRRFYEEELKRLDTERNLPISIIMGDVDGLKLVNDSFGHVMGDRLLQKAAEVIKKGCREDDIIARLGGDEFVVLLPKTDAFEAEEIIKRIRNLESKEKVGPLDISISFGSDTKSTKEEDIREILKSAENSMYRNKLSLSSSSRSKTIELIMKTLYERGNEEKKHSLRVGELCEAIAKKMKFSKDEVKQLRLAGLMHDIGKIGIGEKVLNKPQVFDGDDWQEIQRHSETGYRILSLSNEYAEIADYILEHHERWDGKGYPRGLRGEEISLQARIIAVADAFDAMTSSRPYRKALSEEEALSEIRRFSYTQLDPAIAKIFVEEVCGKSGFFEKEKKIIN